MDSLEQRLKDHARHLGFDRCGITTADEADGFDSFRAWLNQGNAGEMAYLEEQAVARRDPSSILAGVRSVIMVAMIYNVAREPRSGEREILGRVARYAMGSEDYHKVLWKRLGELLNWLREQRLECRGRAVVDTAPLLERDFARRAGLGWFGKNTMLIDKHLGSYFFLGALLVDLELQPDSPHFASHCGTCTACLDACPTEAFPRPHVLDARKCISYLTIELRGPMPEALRPGVGDWLFGCDICQEVCPWNQKSPPSREEAFQPAEGLDPMELLSLSEDEFRKRFRHTALWRTKRRGLLRNACIVLGNKGDRSCLAALERAKAENDSIISEAADWAIRQINERANTTDLGIRERGC